MTRHMMCATQQDFPATNGLDLLPVEAVVLGCS